MGDRLACQPVVVGTREAADADGADAAAALEGGDAAQEEREERVEAHAFDRLVLDLLGEVDEQLALDAIERTAPG